MEDGVGQDVEGGRGVGGERRGREPRAVLAGVVRQGRPGGLEFPGEAEGVAVGGPPVEGAGGEVGQPGPVGRVAGAPQS